MERTEAPLDIGTAAPQTERAGSSQGSGTAPASAVYGAIQGEKYVGSPLLDAGAGGPGGGGAGRNRWRWGGGGGGGGGAGGGPVSAVVAAVAGYVTARSRADPHFFFKLVAECGNDAVIIVGVNMAARGSRFLHEIEFVLCHLTVSLLCDVALVSMLAPTVGVARPATGLGAALARLPANVFEPSSIASKLGCLVYKGVLYAFTGAVMGYTGTQVRLNACRGAVALAGVPLGHVYERSTFHAGGASPDRPEGGSRPGVCAASHDAGPHPDRPRVVVLHGRVLQHPVRMTLCRSGSLLLLRPILTYAHRARLQVPGPRWLGKVPLPSLPWCREQKRVRLAPLCEQRVWVEPVAPHRGRPGCQQVPRGAQGSGRNAILARALRQVRGAQGIARRLSAPGVST